jgi:hypothetical protein
MPQANPEWLKYSFYFFEKSGGSGRGRFLRLGSSLFALQIFLATLLLNGLIGLLAHMVFTLPTHCYCLIALW